MAVYIELFHGRTSSDEELKDWGFQGPILGPYPYIHTTYGGNPRTTLEDYTEVELPDWDKDGLIPYLGSFYGDMTIYADDQVRKSKDLLERHTRTLEILKLTDNDLPRYINDPEQWIKQYAISKLRGET